MNHHTPPSSPPINHQTTFQILKKTTTIITSHPITFLFLSSLLFTFHTNLQTGSHHLTSFLDHNPSLKSLFSLLSTTPHHGHRLHPHHLRHRRRPFLHLTRVGTLDEDFFSGDDHYDRSFFGSNQKIPPNSSFLYLSPTLEFSKLGLSDSGIRVSKVGNLDNVPDNGVKVSESGLSENVPDNGIRVSEIIRSGVSFKSPDPKSNSENYNATHEMEKEVDLGEKGVHFEFFIKGFELGRHDLSTLLILVGVLSAAFGYVMIGFLVTYAWILGIVFFTVVNDLLGKYVSVFRSVWVGSNLGLKRLSGFILMKWAVRDALTQLLGIWFFGEIEDQYLFFKIFVRLKLMPFSITSVWVRGYERESVGFLVSWVFLDTVLGIIFAVGAWVSVVDSRKSGREVVKEGFYLLLTMLRQGISIKYLEAVICGSFARWVLTRYCGKLFASLYLSVMEVYFMVAWLIYYFAARYKAATLVGRPFGRRELEGFLQGR